MANDRVTVNGVNREVDSEWVTVNGVYRKVNKSMETVNGVWREGYTSYDPNIPGTWTFSLRGDSGTSGVSTPYYTLFTRAKAEEAIAHGYTHITFDFSARLYNTAGDQGQRFTVVACSSAPSNYSWSIDILRYWEGSHSYETVSARLSWPLSRMSSVQYATAFGFQAGIYTAYYYYEVNNGQVTNVHFT